MNAWLRKTWNALAVVACGAVIGVTVAPGCGGEGNGPCTDGKVYASPPGCGSGMNELAIAGCYERCTTPGQACTGNKVCTTVEVNPCPCDVTGEECCDACSGGDTLCLDPP